MRPIENICVIIDPWEFPKGSFTDTVYENILTFLDNNTSLIDTVILSSSQVPYKEYLNNKNWTYNKNLHNKKINWFKKFGNEIKQRTDPKFLNYKNKNYNQIIAQFPEEVDNIINSKHVYYVGSTFEICVRDSTLGYQWFVDNTKSIILTKPELLMSKTSQHPNLDEDNNWSKTQCGFYAYRRYFHESLS